MLPTLHHYPPSLFSEKIRVLFGYLDLEWQSVIISPIMPRPLLMPLSGGYRKTPILQLGANIYCDTQVIARKLAAVADDRSIYAQGFAADRVAQWADTELFRTVVALNFRPSALATQMSQLSQSEIEAFREDRAQLTDGAPIVSVPPEAAEAHFQGTLSSLERSLEAPFLFGDQPSIADFSVYHCLWFVGGNEVNAELLSSWPNVNAFMDRMRDFGHGRVVERSAEDAHAEAADSTPLTPESEIDPLLALGLQARTSVAVAPTDYGRIPVRGELVKWTADEIAIQRKDDEVGTVIVHFPNTGFSATAL